MQPPARTPQKAPRPGAFLLFGPLLPALVILALVLPAPVPAAAPAETTTVRHVLDGDTAILADERQIRLIGINTPELGRDGAPDQPLATAARDRLRDLVERRPVRLEFEAESRDHYGRWLAHLRLADGRSVEELLLKEGLAFAIAIPPNVDRLARHRAAEAEARAGRRGVWGEPYYAAVDPRQLAAQDTGFRRVRGRVTHIGRSRKFIYLDMAPAFALRIGHEDWRRHFPGRPEDWLGAELEARGWVTEQNRRLHMAIAHPAMIERIP